MTHAELAEKLGVNRQVVTWHSKKPEAPPISDVEAWRAYLDDKNAAVDGKMSKKLAAQRLRKWIAEADMAERENKIRSGEYCEFSEVRKVAVDVFSFFFGEFDRLRQTLPSLLKGRSELEILTEWDRQTVNVKPSLQNKLRKFIQDESR